MKRSARALDAPLLRTGLICAEPPVVHLVARQLRLIDLEPCNVLHWSEALEHCWDPHRQSRRRRLECCVLDLRDAPEGPAATRLREYPRFLFDYCVLTGRAEPKTILLADRSTMCAAEALHPCAELLGVPSVTVLMLEARAASQWPALVRACLGELVETGEALAIGRLMESGRAKG